METVSSNYIFKDLAKKGSEKGAMAERGTAERSCM